VTERSDADRAADRRGHHARWSGEGVAAAPAASAAGARLALIGQIEKSGRSNGKKRTSERAARDAHVSHCR